MLDSTLEKPVFKENDELIEKENENEDEKVDVNLEALADQKISEMEEAQGAFDNGGVNQLSRVEESIDLDSEDLNELKEMLELDEKLLIISEKAKQLFKNAKSAMSKAVAIGMATMTFSGAGNIEESSAEELIDNGDKIEAAGEVDQSTGLSEKNKELLKQMREAIKLSGYDKDQGAETDAKETRDDLVKHVGSQEYFEKLKIEYKGDDKKAKKEQEKRLEHLDQVDFEFIDSSEMSSRWAAEKSVVGKFIPLPEWVEDIILSNAGILEGSNVGAYYDQANGVVVLPKGTDNKQVQHELLHASMNTDELTESARKILEESYQELGTGEDTYQSLAEERIVRKQTLDLEMDELGIKKYGEKFTKEHFEKMMNKYLNGRFSQGANEFIKTTKPVYFEKIFNEIAMNKKKDSDLTEQA